MKQRHTRRFISLTMVALVAVLASGTAVVVAATAPPQEETAIPWFDSGEQGDDGLGATSFALGCRKNYASGSGTGLFNWCFSDDGNITHLEHPAGVEHIDNGTVTEGWCLSANGAKKAETRGSGANVGLQPPTYSGTRKVLHKTLDGDIRIKQAFVQSKTNRQITIIMEVRNDSNEALQDVFLTRFVDSDMANTTNGDVMHSGVRSVVAIEPENTRLELGALSPGYFANSMIFNDFTPTFDNECYNAAADGTKTLAAGGDRSMAVMLQLGAILPGSSTQVKFSYRIRS